MARWCSTNWATSANSWSFFAPSWNRTSVMGFSKTQVLGSPCVTATLQVQYLLHVYSIYLLNIPTHLFTQSPLATAFTQNTLSRPSRDLVFKAFAFDISWLTHSTPWWPFNRLPIYLSIYLSRASSRVRTNDILFTKQVLYQLSYGGITAYNVCHSVHFVSRRTLTACVRAVGFEPTQPKATDLQSAPALQLWRAPKYRVAFFRVQSKSLMKVRLLKPLFNFFCKGMKNFSHLQIFFQIFSVVPPGLEPGVFWTKIRRVANYTIGHYICYSTRIRT